MSKEKEGTNVPTTAAPYNSNSNHMGKGRRCDRPPPLDASAQWRVHAILRGNGYRRAKHNVVCARLVAG